MLDKGLIGRLGATCETASEIPAHRRVLESLEAVRGRATLSDGHKLTAGMLCDRFAFRGAKARTLVRDLSGGQRRRLPLMRLLMDEPTCCCSMSRRTTSRERSRRGRSPHEPKRPPERNRAMTARDDAFIKTVRIYEGDELVFDARDPGCYHAIKTARDLAAFQPSSWP